MTPGDSADRTGPWRRRGNPPLILVTDATPAALRVAQARLRCLSALRGEDACGSPPVRTVRDASSCALAVLDALTFATVVAELAPGAPPAVGAQLYEDLARLGRVEFVTAETAEPATDLTSGQLDFIRLLARGCSLAEAARRVHVSERTAHRWSKAARDLFHAGSTAELLSCLASDAARWKVLGHEFTLDVTQ